MPCTRYATVKMLEVLLAFALLYRLGATPCEDKRDKDGGDKSVDEEADAHTRPANSSKEIS